MTTGKQAIQHHQAGGKLTQSVDQESSRRLPEALRGKALPTLDTFQSLTPDQRNTHRENIGMRVEAILSQFWRDEDTPDAVAALEVEGWMDVLEYTTPHEIRMAWADYQKEGPRTKAGKLYRPDAGAIHNLIMRRRRLSQPAPQQKPEEERRGPKPTDEQRASILEQYGMGHIIKRFGSK